MLPELRLFVFGLQVPFLCNMFTPSIVVLTPARFFTRTKDPIRAIKLLLHTYNVTD